MRELRHDRWQEWVAARRADENQTPVTKLVQSVPEGPSRLAWRLDENSQPGSKLVH